MVTGKLKQWPYFAGVLLVLLLARIIPVVKSPMETLAYDYGFYRYAFMHAPSLFSLSAWQNYSSPLFVICKWFALRPEPTLIVLLLCAWLVAGACLFWMAARWGRSSAVVATLLFVASPAMLQAHAMFLWKNVWGLVWLLLAYGSYKAKKYYLLVAALLLLVATHRTSAIFAFATIAVYVIWELVVQKKYYQALIAGVVVVAIAAALEFWLQGFVLRFLSHPNKSVIEGIFLDGPSYLLRAFPYLIVGCIGFVYSLRRRVNLLLSSFFVVTMGWMLIDLPFANRALLYADLALILFSAYTLSLATTKRVKQIVWACVILSVLLSLPTLIKPQQLITGSEIQEIATFPPPHYPLGFVLTTDAADAPWLLGYLPLSRLAAPGLFEDYHTYSEWQSFWNNQEGGEFFERYPAPLYLYERSSKIPPIITPCLEQLTSYFYKYTCY